MNFLSNVLGTIGAYVLITGFLLPALFIGISLAINAWQAVFGHKETHT